VAVSRRPAPGAPGYIARWLADRALELERAPALERAKASAPVDASWDRDLAEDTAGHGFSPFEGG
jgi:hypothetical protein